jgi:hypothetical protein
VFVIIGVIYVLGLLQHEDVCNIADVLEVYDSSFLRAEVCKFCVRLYTNIYVCVRVFVREGVSVISGTGTAICTAVAAA